MSEPRVLVLYSKPGCHLCEELRAELDELQPELGYTIDEIDITQDPALFERYRHEIPVLVMDGAEVGRGRIDPEMVVRQCRRGSPPPPKAPASLAEAFAKAEAPPLPMILPSAHSARPTWP